jgi:hypothetical protein
VATSALVDPGNVEWRRSLRFEAWYHRRRMNVYLDRIAACHRVGRPASDRLLRRLQIAWGNTAYSGSRRFLAAMLRVLRNSDGPVLECGSGLSTLILAAALAGEGQLISLEHHQAWRELVRTNERMRHSENAVVADAPLVSYGEFSWYAVDKINLPRSFGFVVCDGPPGDTPGGRYGLVPVLRSRLHAGSMILLDDTQRESEQNVARRWMNELPADIVEESDTYLLLRVR